MVGGSEDQAAVKVLCCEAQGQSGRAGIVTSKSGPAKKLKHPSHSVASPVRCGFRGRKEHGTGGTERWEGVADGGEAPSRIGEQWQKTPTPDRTETGPGIAPPT